MSSTRGQTINFGSFFTQKKCWTSEEDQLLILAVTELGNSQWPTIASRLPGRTGKQCRERWHNHLQDGIIKTEWTPIEDRMIVALQNRLGNQWAKIAKYFYGRSDNAIKNRFHVNERNIRNGTMTAYSDSDEILNELLVEYWSQFETDGSNIPVIKYSLDVMDEMPDNKSRKIATSSTDAFSGDTSSVVVETPLVTQTSSDEFDALCSKVQYTINSTEVLVSDKAANEDELMTIGEDFHAIFQRENTDKSVDTNRSSGSSTSIRKSFNSSGSGKLKSGRSDKSDDSTSSNWNIFATMSPVTNYVSRMFQNDDSNNTVVEPDELDSNKPVKRKTFMSYFSGENDS